MTRAITPPAPDHLPEEEQVAPRARARRRSRYDRPRTVVSWLGLILGIGLGLAAGLYYTWNVNPVKEKNIGPHRLNEEDRDHYLVAIMLDYAYGGDLTRTIARLNSLRLPGNDPIQAVADVACRLARSGYVNNSSGLRAVRSMIRFYRQQNRTGCADSIIVFDDTQLTQTPGIIILPTSTPMPPASKTPTPPVTGLPSVTPARPIVPTSPPSRAYDLIAVNTFCDVDIPGVIEVRVRDYSGQETPGQPIRVRWSGGESLFFTGLKPERGLGYADFQMEAGRDYIVEMPRLSDPITEPLLAVECYTEAGNSSIISYRLIFQGE